MENKKSIEKINENKKLFTWKIDKIDKPLDRLTKKKKKKKDDTNAIIRNLGILVKMDA